MNATNVNSSAPGVDIFSGYYQESQAIKAFRLSIEVLIALLGVLGNIAIYLAIAWTKKLHTFANYYISNLAAADLGVLLLNFPLAVMKEQNPLKWPLGEFFCRYIYPVGDVFHGVSVWSITTIAVVRYRAIVCGIRARPNRHAVPYTILGLWLTSFLVVSVPLFFVVDFKDFRPDIDLVDCTPSWPDVRGKDIFRQSYMIGIAVFWYVLPLAIITCTYIKIGRKLRTSTRFHRIIRESCAGVRGKYKCERENAKAGRLLTPVVLVFAVTMLPLNGLRLAVVYWPALQLDRFLWVYYNTVVLLVIANSSVNSVIYALVSRDFRRAFANGLYKCRGKKPALPKGMFIRPCIPKTFKDPVYSGNTTSITQLVTSV